MLKSFKSFVIIFVFLVSGNLSYAQSEAEYKDVILDGKPAKLNVATGEIILVNSADKNKNTSKTVVKSPDVEEVKLLDQDSDFHTVKDAETLLDLSNIYKVSLTELKEANNLETTLISKGQILRVKNFDSYNKIVANNVSPNNVISTQLHIVKKGETLYSLSRRYAMTVRQLKELNDLTGTDLAVNQKLRVKSFTTNQTINQTIWTVVKGDTLFSIARRNNMSVEELKRLNGLSGNLIHVGQKLELK